MNVRTANDAGRLNFNQRGLILLSALAIVFAGCVSFGAYSGQTFTSTDGQFRVTIPGGAMTETTFEGSGPFAGATIHAFTAVAAGGPRYAVVYGDAPPEYVATTPRAEIYAAAEAGNVASTGGVQTTERSLDIAGYPGREQRVNSGARAYVFRLVLVGSRSYVLSVTGSASQVDSAEAVAYLDSFEPTMDG
jgi:hypothetical protein